MVNSTSAFTRANPRCLACPRGRRHHRDGRLRGHRDRARIKGATEGDLAETVAEVEALDRRIVARKADVRDYAGLKAVLDEGVAQLGRLDIVSANAGIFSHAPTAELTEDQWGQMLDVNLTGVWRTCKAAIPHLVAGGRGGSIIITSSVAGLRGMPNFAHYAAAKHGLVGLMRSLALELAPHSIRVNSVHPGNVNTPMVPQRGPLPDVHAPQREPHEGGVHRDGRRP